VNYAVRLVVDGLWLSIPTAMLLFGILREVVGYFWIPLLLLTLPWNIAAFGTDPTFGQSMFVIVGAHINGCLLVAIVRRMVRKKGSHRPAIDREDEAPAETGDTGVWRIITMGFAALAVISMAVFVYVLVGT
jgi:hypothetical protein